MDAPIGGEGNIGACLGACDADISETPFFLETREAFFIERALMREKAFLPSGEKHRFKLKSLGAVQRHQVDLVDRIILLDLHDERDVLKIACQRIEMFHGTHEFAQVVELARGIG